MRYHYEKPTLYLSMYGETYGCNHPVYNTCTLFKMDNHDSTNYVGIKNKTSSKRAMGNMF